MTEVLQARPRVSDRRVLLVAVAVLLAVVLLLAGLTRVQRLRGGSPSPAALAAQLTVAVDAEDLGRLAGLLDPAERTAVQRLSGALTADLSRLDLPGVDVADGSGGLTLAGAQLDLTGTRADVEQLSADVALLTFGAGQLRVRVDPSATHGLLAAYLTDRRSTTRTDRTLPLVQLGGPQRAVRVLAVRDHGRWYASLLLSLLERDLGPGSSDSAPARGALPPVGAPGSSSPEAAAAALVTAATEAYDAGDPAVLASALDRTGAIAAALYGPALTGSTLAHAHWRVDRATFRSIPQGPGRAVVQVEGVALSSPSRTITATPRCITEPTGRHCLTASGYRYPGSPGSGAFELLGRGGALGLSTVPDDQGWHVGVADSVADAIVAYAGGLTREQGLALLGRARLDAPRTRLVPDRAGSVAFTSAGYAVADLHIDRAGLYRLLPSPAGFHRGSVYQPDGTPAQQKFYPNDDSYQLAPGDYTVLLWADDDFAATLRNPDRPYVQRVEFRRVRAA